MTTCRRALAVPTVAAMIACGGGDLTGPITELPRELTAAELALIEADNAFAFRLFREVNHEEPEANVFISPLSVSMALGMTYNGAAGETMDAMATTLGFGGLSLDEVNQGYRDLIDLLVNLDDQVEFDLANSIWHRTDFAVEQAFLDANRAYFDAQIEALNFAAPEAADIIDQWVKDHTNGRIEKIAPRPIPANIVMFLINAVYFKGDWTHQFQKALTRGQPFRLEDGSEKSVPTMRHERPVPVRLTNDELVDVIEMPYGGDAYAMVVAVPREGTTLDGVISALDRERWEGWIAGLDSAEVVVQMPKFKFEYDIKLNDVLSALGMQIAFDPGRADFARINPQAGLYIDRVQHKTFVNVDEVGTEAAATTSVLIAERAAESFVIDRPFIFALRERLSGTILFIGRMMDPIAQ